MRVIKETDIFSEYVHVKQLLVESGDLRLILGSLSIQRVDCYSVRLLPGSKFPLEFCETVRDQPGS